MKKLKVVLSEEQIHERIVELGKQITADYQGKTPIVICMLKGAVIFYSDLIREIKVPLELDFARFSSYNNGMESGHLEVISDISSVITGRDVIIVEDVVDTGKTLSYFVKILEKRHPSSIKICAFLDKPERRTTDIKVDYIGFQINCGFVLGYGMDYAQKYRELPFLAEINSPADLED